MGIIYRVVNLVNGKQYIGQTSRFTNSHDFLSGPYYGSGRAIKLAVKKYGTRNFVRRVILTVPTPHLNHYEQLWISKLGSQYPRGYNIAPGGIYRSKISEEGSRKLSECARKRTPWNKGKHGVQEPWRKGKGHLFRGENNPNYGNRGSKSKLFGRKHSPETIAKMVGKKQPRYAISKMLVNKRISRLSRFSDTSKIVDIPHPIYGHINSIVILDGGYV